MNRATAATIRDGIHYGRLMIGAARRLDLATDSIPLFKPSEDVAGPRGLLFMQAAHRHILNEYKRRRLEDLTIFIHRSDGSMHLHHTRQHPTLHPDQHRRPHYVTGAHA